MRLVCPLIDGSGLRAAGRRQCRRRSAVRVARTTFWLMLGGMVIRSVLGPFVISATRLGVVALLGSHRDRGCNHLPGGSNHRTAQSLRTEWADRWSRGFLRGKPYVLMDRDGKFSPAFQAILKTECAGPPSFDNPCRWNQPGAKRPRGATESRWTTTLFLSLWKRYHAHQIINPDNPVRCARDQHLLQSKKLGFQRSQYQAAVGSLAAQDILAGGVLSAAYQFHDGGGLPIVAQVDDQALRRRRGPPLDAPCRLPIGVAQLHVGRTFHWESVAMIGTYQLRARHAPGRTKPDRR